MRLSPICSVARIFVALLFLLPAAGRAVAQEESLNERYRFPVSIGAEYQMLTPFGAYAGGFNTYEAAFTVRVPVPPAPTFQPLGRAGIMQFTGTDADTQRWSHTHYYGGLGLAWANRIDKTFELAAEVAGGLSQAVFRDLVPDDTSGGYVTVGNLNGFLEAGGRISLVPSYNLAIDIHPGVKWIHSLGALADFNGPIFGIGFAVNYRFGTDPDAPAVIIRSIRFSELEFPQAFAAMKSYYARNPIGSVVIENTDKNAVTDVRVLFEQKGYMDAPTPCATIDRLEPNEQARVDLLALYNSSIFLTEGATPLTGEIITTYSARGRPVEQRSSVSYVLRDKTSMTWTDDAKVAAFITHEDSALRNYASWVRQACRESTVAAVSGPLQTATQVYEALGELGVLYQTDPSKPAFEQVQDNPVVIDSVSLPRDTLARTTGDCDDLTVLYCALLESVGIDTGFITVPGHIYAAFNTGVAARDFRQVHPDREMTMPINGELWVPVEITLIGKQGFLSAWRRGMDQWRAQEGTPERRALYLTAEAQQTYWPVGLQQSDLGLQYGSADILNRAFQQELLKLSDLIVEDYRTAAAESGRKQDYNRLGIAYARLERLDAAIGAFEQALRLDRDYTSAQVNLGNVQFLKGNHSAALSSYNDAYNRMQVAGESDTPLAAQVLLNISRAHYELGQFDDAKAAFERAAQIDAAAVAEYAYIGSASGTGRAAEATGPQVLFVGEGD